ncbi:MAG: DUF445 domain-containing protein [Phenylobacterium sp.]|uniref:DUF445 domain-containing protein n=1 Tax=Phenylobacterium sp. TaxID=1871053 RepID=UPI002733B990|nr:DUF445 domain-containing protein [Phenylobacterium sp.]MDP3174268.1 DUF445 domain-containing protein [Phenylobacterium sp.]
MTQEPDVVSEADARRARDFARMRAVATGLLGLMAVVFVAASLARVRWPHLAPALGYVRAFAEAGMVGACADWFAVTALFRRPFGLPIPHTGIIPRNKARIGEALGGFIADNFLTERVLEEKLRQLEVARWGGDWLARPANARRLARRLAAILPQVIAALPPGALREVASSAAFAAARTTPAGPLASRALAAIWNDGRAQVMLDLGIERLGGYLAEHQETIRAKVSQHSYRWLPKWVDRMIADKVTDGLLQMLQEMHDPDHPWRLELRDIIERYIARLASDPELQARAEAFKMRMLADPGLRAQADELWTGLEGKLAEELAADARGVADRLERALLALGAWLAGDLAAQARLNEWARLLVRRGIAPRRREIGMFVAQVVASWDARSIVDKLELQVGKDLQYIRVNGTLVGGLVGLAIYATARAFGLD